MIKWYENYFSRSKKLEELSKLLYNSCFNTISRMKENIKKNYVQIHEILARNGWYYIDILGTDEMSKILNNKNNNHIINKIMTEHAKELLPTIEPLMSKYYPHRVKIIKDAINAHNKGKYSLSIPVFLSQADGITKELFGVGCFNREYKTDIPKTKEARKSIVIDETTSYMYLYPLDIKNNLNESFKFNRDKFFSRHGVMHGLDTEYDKKINSLRCIVLFYYLLAIRDEFVEST